MQINVLHIIMSATTLSSDYCSASLETQATHHPAKQVSGLALKDGDEFKCSL